MAKDFVLLQCCVRHLVTQNKSRKCRNGLCVVVPHSLRDTNHEGKEEWKEMHARPVRALSIQAWSTAEQRGRPTEVQDASGHEQQTKTALVIRSQICGGSGGVRGCATQRNRCEPRDVKTREKRAQLRACRHVEWRSGLRLPRFCVSCLEARQPCTTWHFVDQLVKTAT